MERTRAVALLQALLVTFLWSTSWVLIKIGLEEIPALTFAGLRYFLAFLILLPLALRRGSLRGLGRSDWFSLTLLGVVMYALTQGSQFLALSYLPAQTTSLVLSFSPALVALLGIRLLDERLVVRQWLGIVVYLLGALLFLYPVELPGRQLVGMAVIVVGLVANAFAGIIGRAVNRSGRLTPLTVTVGSMGIGSVLLLGTGVSTQGMPSLEPAGWAIVAWLAAVNTALAFTLWNHTLRTLSAMESSVVNNTMLIQIAILAWVFLGEALGPREVLGLMLAAAGTLTVQLGRRSLRTGRSDTDAPVPTTHARRGLVEPGGGPSGQGGGRAPARPSGADARSSR